MDDAEINNLEIKIKLMQEAIRLATENVTKGGGPFGAVIADKEGNIVATGVNRVTAQNDPTAHGNETEPIGSIYFRREKAFGRTDDGDTGNHSPYRRRNMQSKASYMMECQIIFVDLSLKKSKRE